MPPYVHRSRDALFYLIVDDLFDQLERVRFALVRANARGLAMGQRLHEANNFATAAYAWDTVPADEKRIIEERMRRFILECDQWLKPGE